MRIKQKTHVRRAIPKCKANFKYKYFVTYTGEIHSWTIVVVMDYPIEDTQDIEIIEDLIFKKYNERSVVTGYTLLKTYRISPHKLSEGQDNSPSNPRIDVPRE